MRNFRIIYVVIPLVLFALSIVYVKHRFTKELGLTPSSEDIKFLDSLFPSALDVFIAKEEHNPVWSQGMTYTAYWAIIKRDQFLSSIDDWTTATSRESSRFGSSWMLKASSHNRVFTRQLISEKKMSHSVYCFALEIPEKHDSDSIHIFVSVYPKLP